MSPREALGQRHAASGRPSFRPGVALSRGLLVIAALVVAFAGGEAATRVLFRHVRSTADGRSFFARRGEVFLHNRFGFRERDFRGEVPAERYRLALVGDSMTMGQGIDTHDRYGDVLQRYLGASEYEVLNFGMGGNDLHDHDRVLEQVVLPLGPDFVLLQLYVNDFEPPDAERPPILPVLPFRDLDYWLFRSSALYAVATMQWHIVQPRLGLSRSYPTHVQGLLRDPESDASRASTTILRQVIERGQRAGVPVGVAFFPNLGFEAGQYPFDFLHERVEAICRDHGIQCLDLRYAFSRYSPPSRLWVNRFDSHPNELANRVAAAAMLGRFGRAWAERRRVEAKDPLQPDAEPH